MDQDEHSPSVFYYAKDLETFDSETETGTRVPYNKLLTNLARSGRTGEYWSLVVFVRTSLRSVRCARSVLSRPRANIRPRARLVRGSYSLPDESIMRDPNKTKEPA